MCSRCLLRQVGYKQLPYTSQHLIRVWPRFKGTGRKDKPVSLMAKTCALLPARLGPSPAMVALNSSICPDGPVPGPASRQTQAPATGSNSHFLVQTPRALGPPW